jgi:RNA polymerase sigma factor (sigma-70 family)
VRTDEQLMQAYAAGENGAFRELFHRYAALVARIIGRGIARQDIASELIQETFLQFHRARGDYDPARPLRPWLTTIAMNVRRDYLRRIQRRPEGRLQNGLTIDPEAPAIDPHAATEATRLRQLVAQLPNSQRTVIELHWFEGLSFPEVASVLGANPSAVKVRAHRGYKRLRVLLTEKKSVTVCSQEVNH